MVLSTPKYHIGSGDETKRAALKMTKFDSLSVRIKNYKCFGEEGQGLDQFLLINLIIGRNNSGKSTLLELIQHAISEKIDFPRSQWHANQTPQMILEHPLVEQELRAVFNESRGGEGVPAPTWWAYGKRWIGKKLQWEPRYNQNNAFIALDPPFNISQGRKKFEEGLAHAKTNPLSDKTFKRLLAERDIRPEIDTDNPSLGGTGQGATNVLQHFVNKAALPSELVKHVLLGDLNKIFEPDCTYSDIVCQQLENKSWEVYLEEEAKGKISLSNSGSGLQTILLVLIFLYLIPYLESKKLGAYIFAFEELENNLHPALLRRLLSYLRSKALDEGCLFFLTTHSNVAIDLFSKDDHAQILHVMHDGKRATIKTVKTYVENKGILDDLDVRASDLLQSNGIIWLEGPSDRLYLNRWIGLWSDGELREGTHYQCVFFGGKLLAHLSGDAPDSGGNDWVKLLRINRNAIILIDSDKGHNENQINATKTRIVSEIESVDGFAWVTKGREVEHYIPVSTLKTLYGKQDIQQVGRFDDFDAYLNIIKDGEGKRFLRNKPLFAERVCQYLEEEQLSGILDLTNQLNEVCSRIRSWNGI